MPLHSSGSSSPSHKRRKLDGVIGTGSSVESANELRSLHKSVSPPRLKRTHFENEGSELSREAPPDIGSHSISSFGYISAAHIPSLISHPPCSIASPVQLNRMNGLQIDSNADTIGLNDIIGDPLIKECWQFNFLYDLDFLMQAIDPDIRHLVRMKIVHGSWRRDDRNWQRLQEASRRYPNISLITAHMPEPFGTHHTKMMCIFRHDDTAEIVIHTANMIRRDWEIMCQAIWRSPRLPLLLQRGDETFSKAQSSVGSGLRFKEDFLAYLGAYNNANKDRTSPLISKLSQYDFSKIRAALVGSVPCKQRTQDANEHRSWGWPGLSKVLEGISVSAPNTRPTIVVQVSSIASLGQNQAWFDNFTEILNTSQQRSSKLMTTKLKIIYPTAAEIRSSVGGYESGGSIHMKTTTPAQMKQLKYLQPLLCHWAGGFSASFGEIPQVDHQHISKAGRWRAAPHIKTYIRFSDSHMESIDWAMITSANISTQAWGGLPNKEGEIRICSWELGVVFWPSLFANSTDNDVVIVPTFKSDNPIPENFTHQMKKTVVGFRMPYDLPLVPYGPGDIPWCATAAHSEPDWKGQLWEL